MHVFKYSPRKGTKAAQMSGQIDGNKKEERSQKLIELSDANQIQYNKSYVEKEIEVLFEEEKNGIYKGHTKNYLLVHLKKTNEELENKIIKVKCSAYEKDHILAKKTEM